MEFTGLIKVLAVIFIILVAVNIVATMFGAGVYGTGNIYFLISQISVIMLAVASVGGAVIILRAAKAALQREREAMDSLRVMLESAPPSINVHDKDFNVFDASPVSCFLLDGDRQALDCNQAALDMFVKEPGKCVSQTYPTEKDLRVCNEQCEDCGLFGLPECHIREFLVRNYRGIFPDYEKNKEQIEKSIAECCEKALSVGVQRFEFLSATLYGQTIPCEIIITPIKYRGGHRFAVHIRDLREEKRREVAEEENRAKTRFLARMSHEIRTPMSAVIGITEIELQKSEHPPETEEAFLRIYSSSSLLLTIINDILDLSKIEASKMEIFPALYDLPSLIVDTVQLNMMHVGSKRVEFKLEIDERLPIYMIGDEQRIKQILNNLLSNAFKYTENGLVVLSFGMETKGADIMLVLCVKDTGQGMTDKQLDGLFEIAFTRFNVQSNHAIEGSGLGMMIAHHLVTLMGGDISVKSAVGEGSEFTVRLPQKTSGTGVLGKDAVENLQNIETIQKSLKMVNKFMPTPMPYGRVLVVDDVDSNLYVARGALMPYKLTVETASDGYGALERIEAGELYDIVFMDHMMPGIDGIEVTKRMRRMGYENPIVALTANVVTGVSEVFLQSGFDGFISKPIDLHKLNACLNRYIRDRHPEEAKKAVAQTKCTVSEVSGVSMGLMESFLLDAKKAVDTIGPLIESLKSDKKFEIDAQSLKSFVIQAHAMKSALANIRETELSEIAFALEQAGRKGAITTIKSKAPRFLDSLRKIITDNSPEEMEDDSVDENIGLLKEQLLIIASACEEMDLAKAEEALAELKQLRHSKETTERLKEISNNLLYGDYDKAAELAKNAATV